ncbi:MAG: hypothetical protein UT91_C0005G0019 [Parcubacteria group bacterium GW2011_GWA2_40_23]|nr:MAG: hypothetical protein UT91_C0005G0019 [Parcubacteria group bacterium GW2011_GWA2_40_23]
MRETTLRKAMSRLLKLRGQQRVDRIDALILKQPKLAPYVYGRKGGNTPRRGVKVFEESSFTAATRDSIGESLTIILIPYTENREDCYLTVVHSHKETAVSKTKTSTRESLCIGIVSQRGDNYNKKILLFHSAFWTRSEFWFTINYKPDSEITMKGKIAFTHVAGEMLRIVIGLNPFPRRR